MLRRNVLCFCLLCVLCCFVGCARQSLSPTGEASKVSVLQSAPAQIQKPFTVQPVVYVYLRDQTNKTFGLRRLIESAVQSRGYSVTSSPSEAGFILQCNVLFSGSMPLATVQRTVPLGYGKEVGSPGEGADVLMTDVLVVVRTLPTSKSRRHGPALTHSSRRSAVSGDHIRLAAVQNTAERGDAQMLASHLANHVAGLLPNL